MVTDEEPVVPLAKSKKLVVVFDTNSIFTESGFYILNDEVKRLIQETRENTSLQVTWLLPSVVLQERIFRLQQKASSLLDRVSSISDLIDHDLDVTEEVLLEALDRRVQQTLKNFELEIREPNWADIDLKQMVADSTDRLPPFNPGNSEKGFRDAVVLETYMQILEEPRFADHHAVLLTADELLRKAVIKRAKAYDNQYPPGSIEDIRGTIATISEELELELVKRISSIATALFFTLGDPNSIFTRFGIPARIQNEYESTFLSLPPGADLRNTYTPSINPSRFVQKEEARFHWSNQIVFPSVAYRITYSIGPTSSSLGLPPSGSYSTDLFSDEPGLSSSSTGYSSSSGFMLPNPSYTPISNGRTLFDVVWTAVYSEVDGFTDPQVEELIFRGTEWS